MLNTDSIDILSTQPSLHRLFTQVCSVYPVTDAAVHAQIIERLRRGLDILARTFPWLAGHVVVEGSGEGITGISRITPRADIPLVVKDLRDDASFPSLDHLREAGFPMAMLDEEHLSPCKTLNLPGTTFGLVADTGPVFAVQLNFISGGIIITFVAQHNVMDMTGQAVIVKWLSKACQAQDDSVPVFSDEEIAVGNMDKAIAVELLDDDWQPGHTLDHQILRPVETPQRDQKAEPSFVESEPCSWALVNFSSASLQSLKTIAMRTKDAQCEFVSTDDVLSAFIWSSVCRIRLPRLSSSDTTSTFARAVDARSALGLPATYPGGLTNMTYSSMPAASVGQQPLGVVASELRRQLDPKVRDLAHDTRALATLLHRMDDKSKVSVVASVDPSSGISLSSWAKVDVLYKLDFGLGLGPPEVIRRPPFFPVESLMYILPKQPSTGTMSVAMCLREQDWKHLSQDAEWQKHATYVG